MNGKNMNMPNTMSIMFFDEISQTMEGDENPL
jgi:hypothetical protein